MRKLAWVIVLIFLTGTEVVPAAEEAPEFNVPYYTGKICPTPQSAVYRDDLLRAKTVGLLLGANIAPDDARVALLTGRIERLGGVVEIVESQDAPCDLMALIGETEYGKTLLKDLEPPKHPEGYLLHSVKGESKSTVILQGHDFHGLLWAITAFNQLTKVEAGMPVMRDATILDYPASPGVRTYTPFRDDESISQAWLGVNVLRANMIQYRQMRSHYKVASRREGTSWRTPIQDEATYNEWRTHIKKIGAFLNPLQIEWCDAMQPNSFTGHVDDQIRSKNEDDIELMIKVSMELAKAGGHLMILYDDFRFPAHPDDMRDFGSARKADMYLLEKIYTTVAAQYPDFKIMWCPPFYWGPGGDPSEAYGEDRDAYLRAIGERLPKGVDIFWTGPKVKSSTVTKEDVQWITERIGRKSIYWQNACGYYHGGIFGAYPGEPIPAWRDWFYEGFFNDVSYFTFNEADPYTTLTLNDAIWNPKAYDPEASAVDATKKLVGETAYPSLIEISEAIEAMDHYGFSSPTAAAARNIDKIKAETKHIVELCKAAPASVTGKWTKITSLKERRERYLRRLLASPDLKSLTEVSDIVRARAIKTLGGDPKQARVIFTPNDFRAGRRPSHYGWNGTERRYVLWINGARSDAPSMQASFQLPYSLTGHSELTLSALNHKSEKPCRIRISMNGNNVFEGANPFASDQWTTHSFQVKGAFLRDGVPNTLLIENLEDSDVMSGAPWFMVNFATVTPEKKQ